VTNFLTKYNFENDDYYHYDLREPSRKIIHPDKVKKIDRGLIMVENWKNIPNYEAHTKQNLNILPTPPQQRQLAQQIYSQKQSIQESPVKINYTSNYSPITTKNITSKKYRNIKMGGIS
jgi:hypothetical protein